MILPPDHRPTDDQVERAEARVELRALLDSPGWKRIERQLLSGIEESLNVLQRVNTADSAATIDAVRRWQIRHTDYEALCHFVNGILEPDPIEDDPRLSPMEIILQEELRHGRIGDPGPGTTAAGD
jgi:hypothetical protein